MINNLSNDQANLLETLKSNLPEKNSSWSKEARKIQLRNNRKKYKREKK